MALKSRPAPRSLRITALRDDIIRVRISPGPLPEDASWAVLSAARTKSIDVQAGRRTTPPSASTPRRSTSASSAIRCVSSFAISPATSSPPTPRAAPSRFQLGGFTVSKQMPGGEHYFGLGDKAGSFDRRNQAFTLWNTDIGPQESTDPLYKAIPFFLGISGTRSYGLFLDNTWRTWFDFGKQARDAIAFGSEGGPLDYYFLYGPTPKQVVEGYAYLTGTAAAPSALGVRIPAVALQLHSRIASA